MGTTTPNLGLYKPDGTEFIDEQADLNQNYDKLDAAIKSGSDTATGLQNQITALQSQINSFVNPVWTTVANPLWYIIKTPTKGVMNGTTRYNKAGKLAHLVAELTVPSNAVLEANGTDLFLYGFPDPPKINQSMGFLLLQDVSLSAGGKSYAGQVFATNTPDYATMSFDNFVGSAVLGTAASCPFAPVATSRLRLNLTYELT